MSRPCPQGHSRSCPGYNPPRGGVVLWIAAPHRPRFFGALPSLLCTRCSLTRKRRNSPERPFLLKSEITAPFGLHANQVVPSALCKAASSRCLHHLQGAITSTLDTCEVFLDHPLPTTRQLFIRHIKLRVSLNLHGTTIFLTNMALPKKRGVLSSRHSR